MALKTFRNGLAAFPMDLLSLSVSVNNAVIDATGEAVATLWRSPFTGTIRSIVVRFSGVTTGDTISAELQTVDTASPIPTDTIYATGAAMSFSLTTTMANSWQTISLSAPAVVTAGEMVALVVKRNDTGGAGNFQVTGTAFTGLAGKNNATKALTWANTNATIRCVYPIYSETAAVAALQGFAAWTLNTRGLSAGAADPEIGNVFHLPFASRAAGWFMQMSASAGSIVKVRLYNTDGTTVMASDRWNGQATDGLYWGRFVSSTVLAAAGAYRLSVFVSTGAATIVQHSLADANALDTLHLGSACYATARTGGVWSDNAQLRTKLGLLLDQFDDSSASGGAASGLAHIIGGP